MKEYLDIVKLVLNTGQWKNNRTGTRTLTVPNIHFSYNMNHGFPLLTTRKMPFKSICVELEGFIKGITDKRWYQERGCHFWDEWCNPLKKDFNDLGPIYGYQWRQFNKCYDEYDDGCLTTYDQLKDIVLKLHSRPDDRRMVCSAWNPQQLDRMALSPCHFAWVLTHINGVLNLHWTQRSCDLALGVPCNIASYALLLLLLCLEGNFKPGNLSGMLCDCHIYENHIDGLKEQLQRKPKQLPNLAILNNMGQHENQPRIYFDIFNWVYNDVALLDYNPHPAIKFKIAV